MSNKSFTNTLNGNDLKRAIVDWVLRLDGCEGAIGGVVGAIPWTDEMQSFLPWVAVEDYITDAIPCCDEGANALKNSVEKSKPSIFGDWVDKVANDIILAYNSAIDKLNGAVNKTPTVDNEVEFTNLIFKSMSSFTFLDLEFGDDGNSIFAKDRNSDNEYAIVVKKL